MVRFAQTLHDFTGNAIRVFRYFPVAQVKFPAGIKITIFHIHFIPTGWNLTNPTPDPVGGSEYLVDDLNGIGIPLVLYHPCILILYPVRSLL